MSELLTNTRNENSFNASEDALLPREPLVQRAPQNPRSSSSASLFAYTVLALGLALTIRFFIAAPYVVAGSSMEPNFENWDYLITDRVSYRFYEPERGDVVVFRLPHQKSRTLIKRVIGLPGETVRVGPEGVSILNESGEAEFTLAEPYVTADNHGGPTNVTLTLRPSEYFVLGDNRRVSSDSRSWGALPRDHIVGRVLLRLFPFSHIAVLPAEARYETANANESNL